MRSPDPVPDLSPFQMEIGTSATSAMKNVHTNFGFSIRLFVFDIGAGPGTELTDRQPDGRTDETCIACIVRTTITTPIRTTMRHFSLTSLSVVHKRPKSVNRYQSNLAKGGIAVACPPNSFVFARWQHRTDGLAAICNIVCFGWGFEPEISPYRG